MITRAAIIVARPRRQWDESLACRLVSSSNKVSVSSISSVEPRLLTDRVLLRGATDFYCRASYEPVAHIKRYDFRAP